jgi:hypothetical protein
MVQIMVYGQLLQFKMLAQRSITPDIGRDHNPQLIIG